MALISRRIKIENIEILCSESLSVDMELQSLTRLYLCKYACPQNHYTFKAARLQLSGEIDGYYTPSNLSVIRTPVNCFPCPVGAKCDTQIKALPNYWGYRDQNNFVTMLRCPEGYCCEGNETCKGIDSCNIGRIGTLFGTCKPYLTEALFSSKCISVLKCHNNVILISYIIGIIGYSVCFKRRSSLRFTEDEREQAMDLNQVSVYATVTDTTNACEEEHVDSLDKGVQTVKETKLLEKGGGLNYV